MEEVFVLSDQIIDGMTITVGRLAELILSS